MIVRVGYLLTAAVVILGLSFWVREFALPSHTQVSAAVLEVEPPDCSEETAGSHSIATASQSRRDDGVDDAVDLYGNEVDAAVATYKLDRTGALYELHSPQTEVPQLPPPKS